MTVRYTNYCWQMQAIIVINYVRNQSQISQTLAKYRPSVAMKDEQDLGIKIPSDPLLSKSRGPPFPVIALVVSEYQVISLQIMHNPIHPSVSGDLLHLGCATCGLALAVLDTLGIVPFAIVRGFGFEESHAEPSGLENACHLLDNVGRGLAVLRVRHIGFKRRVGAVRLRGDVHGEVMGARLALR